MSAFVALLKTVAIAAVKRVGTDLLINVCETTLKVLRDRQDNSVGHDDVVRIVNVKNERLGK